MSEMRRGGDRPGEQGHGCQQCERHRLRRFDREKYRGDASGVGDLRRRPVHAGARPGAGGFTVESTALESSTMTGPWPQPAKQPEKSDAAFAVVPPIGHNPEDLQTSRSGR